MAIFSTIQEATRNEAITISNASAQVAQARQFEAQPRKVITIRNVADAATKIIWVNIGPEPAVVGRGLCLRQYESFTDAADGNYSPYQGTINAICEVASATQTLAIFER